VSTCGRIWRLVNQFILSLALHSHTPLQIPSLEPHDTLVLHLIVALLPRTPQPPLGVHGLEWQQQPHGPRDSPGVRGSGLMHRATPHDHCDDRMRYLRPNGLPHRSALERGPHQLRGIGPATLWVLPRLFNRPYAPWLPIIHPPPRHPLGCLTCSALPYTALYCTASAVVVALSPSLHDAHALSS
jgi:hypothetical protein